MEAIAPNKILKKADLFMVVTSTQLIPKGAGGQNAESILHQLDSHRARLDANWLSLSPSANHARSENHAPALGSYNTGVSKKFRSSFGAAAVRRRRRGGRLGSAAFGQEDAQEDQCGAFQ